MSWYLPGVSAVNSTAGTATNPTTSVIAALVHSTGPSTRAGLLSSGLNGMQQAAAYFYLGGSTTIEWWIEHCLSTGLGSTALRNGIQGRTVVYTGTGLTSQFVQKFDLVRGDFIRVRVGAGVTAAASAKIQAEPIA